jgi:pimeloyl-ACP methyl ester carboxylesterase
MRILNWIGRGLLVLVALAAIAYPVADWLRDPLDEAARAALLREGKAQKFVRLPGGIMHVRVQGPDDGPVVLLVHGASTGGYSYTYWMKPLAEAGYRVIVPDLFGYGFSDRPDAPHTKAFYTGQLSDLLDALGANEPIHIVGTSMGGAIVTAFTAQNQARVKSVTLVAPAGNGRVALTDSPVFWPVIGEWYFRVLGAQAFQDRLTKVFAQARGSEGMAIWARDQARFRGYAEGILSTARNYNLAEQPEDYEALGRSGLPVLVVWGTADSTVPFAQSKVLLSRVPQATLVPLEGKEHAITFTDTEAVLAAVLPFLQSAIASGDVTAAASAP